MHLPKFLIDRYRDWKANNFLLEKTLYKTLESNGQKPKAMIISCCDSRVDPCQIFAAKPGDFFIHRNVANIIPKYNLSNKNHEIISSIEYAILTLRVASIIILGHSSCGGIDYAFKKFSGKNSDKNVSSIDNWIQSVNSAYEKVNKNQTKVNTIKSLEKQNILNSIKNLKNYDKIDKLVLENKLQIHGLYFEINTGELSEYNESTKKFELIY